MKLQGELDSTSLSELLQTLSSQRATGLLVIRSDMGEKQIGLSQGEILIYSDRLSQPMRLGDLLVAREILTEDKLLEALRMQRESSPRLRLGDLLVKKELVKEAQIKDAVRFQVEEDICDLFTWRNASFEFDDGRTVEDVDEEANSEGEAAASKIRRLSIDPQALILEAARRIDDWKIIEERLPSPYLVFKLAEKGREHIAKLSGGNLLILKLIQEGRTLDNVVKLSFLGRFTACKTVIRFLEDGWIAPYPSSELRFLASEHRVHGRLTDAMQIFRRLTEFAKTPEEKSDLKKLLDATTEALLRQQDGEARTTGMAVSHKDAARTFQRRQRIRLFILSGMALATFTFAVFYWISESRKKLYPPEYLINVERATEATSKENFQIAVEIWRMYYESLPEKENEFADRVYTRFEEAQRRYAQQLEYQLEQTQLIAQMGRLEEAEVAYRKLQKDHPDNPYTAQIKTALAQLSKQKERRRVEHTLAEWRKRLAEAREMENARRYQPAKTVYTEASEGAEAGSDVRRHAEEGLLRLQKIATASRDHYQIGLEQLKENHAEKAMSSFERAHAEWPELDWAQKAHEKLTELRERQNKLRAELQKARMYENQGRTADAMKVLTNIAGAFGDFALAREQAQRVGGLQETIKAAEGVWKKTLQAEADKDAVRYRELMTEMLKRYRGYMIAQHVKLPVAISTDPPNAKIFRDDRLVGQAPLTVQIGVDESLDLRIEHPGFSPLKRKILQLGIDDLQMFVRLKREAVREVSLGAPVFSPPVVVDGVLYAGAGVRLNAFSATADKKLWSTKNLLDSTSTQRPDSGNSGQSIFVNDPEWWYLREAPALLESGALILSTRARHVLTIDRKDGAFKEILRLPNEAVGRIVLQTGTLLAGKSLLAVACADGNVRVYDPKNTERPQWQSALDEAKYPACAPVGGILRTSDGQIVTASRSGKITAWELVSGKKTWTINLGATLVEAFSPNHGKADADGFRAFTTEDGDLIVADIRLGREQWRYDPGQAGDRLRTALVTPDSVYALARNGTLSRFERKPASRTTPKPLWTKALDRQGPAPVAQDNMLYAATDSGYVYALHQDDGKIMWRYECDGRPTHLAVHGQYLYVATADGKLVVLSSQ